MFYLLTEGQKSFFFLLSIRIGATKPLDRGAACPEFRHGWLISQWPVREIHSFQGENSIFPLSELLYNTAAYLCFLESPQLLLSLFPTELFTFSQILSLAELVNSLPRCWAQCHKYERKKQFWRKHIWKEEDKIVMARLFLFYHQVAVKLPSPERFSCALKRESQKALPSLTASPHQRKKVQMFPTHNTCKSWDRENETDHKESSLLLKQTEIWVIGTSMKQLKKKQLGLKRAKSFFLPETWVPQAPLPGRLLSRETKSAQRKHQNPLWMAKISGILDLLSTEIFSNPTDSVKWSLK